MKTADQMAKNYQQGMAGAGAAYTAGVNAVTVAPTQAAATPEAMAAYQQGVMESITSGRRLAGLQSSTLQAWKDASIKKGANSLTTGAQLAMPKVQAHFAKWQPIYASVHDAVAQMPKGGRANAAARSARAVDMLMSAAGK